MDRRAQLQSELAEALEEEFIGGLCTAIEGPELSEAGNSLRSKNVWNYITDHAEEYRALTTLTLNGVNFNQYLLERLQKLDNVEFVLESTVVELQGETSLTGIVVENVSNGTRQSLQVDGLFVAIGQVPQNAAFSELVETDSHGYIVAGEDCKTNRAGVYAAGDGRTKTVRQLVTAAADGAVAALAAAEYIRAL